MTFPFPPKCAGLVWLLCATWPTDSHSFDGDNAGIGSDGEKGERKRREGGNFAFERNGGNYGGVLRCNIREAGHGQEEIWESGG